MKTKRNNKILFHTIVDLGNYVSEIIKLDGAVAAQLRPGANVMNVRRILADKGVMGDQMRYDKNMRVLFVRGCRTVNGDAVPWLQKMHVIGSPTTAIKVPVTSRAVAEHIMQCDLKHVKIADPNQIAVNIGDYSKLCR